MRNESLIILALLALCAAPASAHVTLTETAARAGSDTVLLFRVGHGCGTSPTTALTIEIPPGIASARPQPKAGWTLEKSMAPGTTRVTAITWRGGSLAADEFDEFAILMRLPNAPGTLAFPATQTCASAVEHWSDPPDSHGKNPAPVLSLYPRHGDAGHGHERDEGHVSPASRLALRKQAGT